MLHDLLRASNKFWHSLYYDELVDADAYQISYLEHADRPYFNCAHTVKSSDDTIINAIEHFFVQRDLAPAFYLDPQSPQDLDGKLFQRGYVELPTEQEHWYELDCSRIDVPSLTARVDEFCEQNPAMECVLFSPMTESFLLRQFLELDALVNDISAPVLEKVRRKLHTHQNDVTYMCALALEQQEPATTGLVGLCGQYAFLAEGATHPNFRRRGIYTWLGQISLLWIALQGVTKVIVNCDPEAYSNNTYRRLGFDCFCSRRFFIKNK